jgi:hypothetical protein
MGIATTITEMVEAKNSFAANIAKIARMTNRNEHGAAIAHGARLLGKADIADNVDRINQEHNRIGYLSDKLRLERHDLYQKLMTHAKKTLSPSDYNAFYKSY